MHWVSQAAFSLLLSAAAVASEGPEWGYHGDVGPANWGDLDPSFATCKDGTAQSPINIETALVNEDNDAQSLEVELESGVPLKVFNNGHTVEAEVGPGEGSLHILGQTFSLLQFHFHTESEHELDGARFPMEMHLVHKAAEGTLAVVGVFIEEGDAHEELDKIFGDPNLPTEETSPELEVEEFDLKALMPGGELKAYRYGGSLTTPPCSEGVLWNMLTEPIHLSSAQIGAFKAIFSGDEFPEGNRRPVQPLNGRVVSTGDDLPVISSAGTVNAASFVSGGLSPGEIVSLFGSALGPPSPGTVGIIEGGEKWSTEAAGVKVWFDSTPGAVLFGSEGQLNAVVPYDVDGKAEISVEVERGELRSNAIMMPVAASAPGIFTLDGSGGGQAVALNQDGSLNMPMNPAGPETIVVFWVTGEGPTSPAGLDGKLALDVLPKPILRVRVLVDGLEAEVLYAGAAPTFVAGLMQVNARLREGVSSGNVSLVVEVGGIPSQAGVTVAVR